MEYLMTTQEVADFLKVKEKTLRAWRTESRGPTYIKLGSLIRYKKEDVEAYLDTRREELGE